jgi:CheY-like chemotaxis protein
VIVPGVRQDKTVVLCVDDEENPLILRKLVLQRVGYDVITATSASEALEIVSAHRIDVVLSDHLMPGGSGTELARQIKSSHPNVLVVLLSGVNEMPADAGCEDLFLSKLEGPTGLCEKISSLLEKRQTRASGAAQEGKLPHPKQ